MERNITTFVNNVTIFNNRVILEDGFEFPRLMRPEMFWGEFMTRMEKLIENITIFNAVDENKGGRQQTVDNRLNRKIIHTNDPQNSHTTINAAKKDIIARLRFEQPKEQLVKIEEIKNALNNPVFHYHISKKPCLLLKYKAKSVVDYIETKCEFSKSAEATDYEVLKRVWTRANDPLNIENADKIRQAIFDALVDF